MLKTLITSLFSYLLLLIPLSAEKNPLFKALPDTKPTFEAALEIEPQAQKFIPVSFRESLEVNRIPTEGNFFQDPGIQFAEKKFSDFCSAIPTGKPSIPRIIHFIWLGSEPTAAVNLAVQSWKDHHTDWEIKLWTDLEIETFPWTSLHSQSLYSQGKNWAEKSDILRLEILYRYGGIYSDTDVICLKSFEDLVTRGLTLFACLEGNKLMRFAHPLIGSAILGASRHSPAIKRCMEYTRSFEEAPDVPQHIRSGPGPISLACYEALESEDENVLILPCSYFYPLPWEKRLASAEEIISNLRPESFAVHLWEGTWCDLYCFPAHPSYKLAPIQ